jgi:amino acid adenylation domain-containing protein
MSAVPSAPDGPSARRSARARAVKCVHKVFEQQVDRTPDATAVVFEDARLTYRTLNERANQLAHHLRARGVGPDVPVALHVSRSLDTIVSVLAILKAGGAYVPLDPGYPAGRLAYMIRDVSAPVLVTNAEAANGELPAYDGRVVHLGRDAPHILKESAANPESGATEENLLYIIYTSGSTGKPKGVMVSHFSVVRLFEAAAEHVDFDGSDVWTCFHSISFGFSVWEIFGALLHGAQLVVVSETVSLSAVAFYELIRRERITVLSQTPSAFRLFLDAVATSGGAGAAHLRLIVFSGEPLEPRLLKSWINIHGDERPQLINMYALTETAGEVAYRRLTARDLSLENRSVIGVPLSNADIHILDKDLMPVPVGTAGELFIGGDAVALGYHGLPGLSDERFRPDPAAGRPGARRYRTGDRARLLPGGEIEFLGRIDNQIKVLGFRIEPGEIESVLTAHPGIDEAVVTAREDRKGDKRLVAYLVRSPRLTPARSPESQGPAPFTSGALREYLKAHLPDYMVPNAFVTLAAMPRTPNGKVDRRALPAPDRQRPDLDVDYADAREPTEKILVSIWCEVLGLDRAGINDDFFELGGNSLLGVQVTTRVFDRYRIEVPLRIVFEAPTIRSLAAWIEAVVWARKSRRAAETEAVAGWVEGEV